MLTCCGTVIASEGRRSRVQISRQRCATCTGHCLRFGRDETVITVRGELELGSRVSCDVPASVLALAVCAVLGIPTLMAAVFALAFGGPVSGLIGLTVGAATAWIAFRMSPLDRMLRPRSLPIDPLARSRATERVSIRNGRRDSRRME